MQSDGPRRLVLFDIDGTLVWTAGAGRSAITVALIEEMGETGPIDDYRFDGKTDPQIIVELMEAAGHPDADNGHTREGFRCDPQSRPFWRSPWQELAAAEATPAKRQPPRAQPHLARLPRAQPRLARSQQPRPPMRRYR